MKVTEIWRYPVKTIAGERLQRVRIGPLGVNANHQTLDKAVVTFVIP